MVDGCNGLDFVIPLCKNNMIIRVTIESVIVNYNPVNIFLITNKSDLEILGKECLKWNLKKTKITFIDEENYFIDCYGLTKTDIFKWYTWKDEVSREYGWWYQQLIKIGGFKQIKNISDPYVVWDSDLIVLEKWDLYDIDNKIFKFAILQEFAKNEFNKNEYSKSINELIGFPSIEPPTEGTFVPHHFIMHHKILNDLIIHIEKSFDGTKNWIEIIMRLSKTYYRFSEYKCIATFMSVYYPELLCFYPFKEYGKNGIRYRDSEQIVDKLVKYLENKKTNINYDIFKDFVGETFHDIPSYIQLEHVIQ